MSRSAEISPELAVVNDVFETHSAPQTGYSQTYRIFTAFIFILSLAMICLTLILCGYVIVGFHENDPQFRALWPAIILSLGMGSMALIPALIVGIASAGRLKYRRKIIPAWLVTAFLLPSLALLIFIGFRQDLPILWSVLAIFSLSLFVLWAWINPAKAT